MSREAQTLGGLAGDAEAVLRFQRRGMIQQEDLVARLGG